MKYENERLCWSKSINPFKTGCVRWFQIFDQKVLYLLKVGKIFIEIQAKQYFNIKKIIRKQFFCHLPKFLIKFKCDKYGINLQRNFKINLISYFLEGVCRCDGSHLFFSCFGKARESINVTQYNTSMSSFEEKIEVFALSNRRCNKLSNDSKFVKIKFMKNSE